MPDARQIVQWEVQVFLLALFGIVAMQLLSGQINTRHILYGRKNNTGEPIVGRDGKLLGRRKDDSLYFSPERVQLLAFTLGAAFWYLGQVLNNPHPGIFPPLSTSWPAIIGGSNAIYLGGKTYSRIWGGNGKSKKKEA